MILKSKILQWLDRQGFGRDVDYFAADDKRPDKRHLVGKMKEKGLCPHAFDIIISYNNHILMLELEPRNMVMLACNKVVKSSDEEGNWRVIYRRPHTYEAAIDVIHSVLKEEVHE